jgi:hypothetical protein
MKYLPILPIALLALLSTASAQLPSTSKKQVANISMDCREVGVGQKIRNDNGGILGILGAGQDREHHKTISIDIRNLGATPADITPVVYFLARDASGGEAIQLAASRSDHFVVKPTEPQHWNVDMPSSIEHVDNNILIGTGAHSGSRPAGWVAGCLAGDVFYPMQASSPTIMDYVTGDAFKTTRTDFEKNMPRDIEKRKAKESQSTAQ